MAARGLGGVLAPPFCGGAITTAALSGSTVWKGMVITGGATFGLAAFTAAMIAAAFVSK
jgi:hypothetical protein